MRVNTMSKTNELPNPFIKYYLLAVVLAVVVGYLLIFVFEFMIILGRLALKYWYAPLIILIVLMYIRRRRRKKREKTN